MDFSLIADAFEKIEATTKRLEMTDYLVDLLKKTPAKVIDMVVYLIQGKICPDYVGLELGVADKLAVRAISIASGKSVDEIEKVYKEVGDLGLAAQKMLEKRRQVFLFKKPLTVERVYENLSLIHI